MEIRATYMDGPPRVITTGGESMVSGGGMERAPEWVRQHVGAAAIEYRPRIDQLLAGQGLTIEVFTWSTFTNRATPHRTVEDFYGRWEVPVLSFHAFRTWDVMGASEAARLRELTIDGEFRFMRLGGVLTYLTPFERLEAWVLSDDERGSMALADRVMLVHERVRGMRPGISDTSVGNLYGMASTLVSWAAKIAKKANYGVRDGVDNGFGDLVERLSGAEDDFARTACLMEAICKDPHLSWPALAHACRERNVDVRRMQAVWDEAKRLLRAG